MTPDDLLARPPWESDWVTLDAARVRAFADISEDWQYIHLDDARAAAETPFGGAVVHGFLTLSMLARLAYPMIESLDGYASSVNYGFDRIRFVAPVRVGARVRARLLVADVEQGDGWVNVHWDVEIEADGADRPAIVANWITRIFTAPA